MKIVSRYDKYRRFLKKDEEIELFHRMKSGDAEARDELILAHSYLVMEIAKEYSAYGPYEDLEHEGFIALTKCCDKYDIEKGRLRTYSYHIIRNNVLRFLSKNRHVIKLPEPQVHQLLTLLRIKDELTIELQRDPSYSELLESPKVLEAYKNYCKTKATKFNLREYVGLLDLGKPVSSLNEPIAEDSDVILEDTIEDVNQRAAFERIESEDIGNLLMEILTDDEKFILKSLAEGSSGQEISETLGIAISSVSGKKIEAIEKIKHHAKNNLELKEIITGLGFSIE